MILRVQFLTSPGEYMYHTLVGRQQYHKLKHRQWLWMNTQGYFCIGEKSVQKINRNIMFIHVQTGVLFTGKNTIGNNVKPEQIALI